MSGAQPDVMASGRHWWLAFVVPGMTIIDGIVRTQRTCNIPPEGEGAGDRGTVAIARAFTSPHLRGEVLESG